MKINIIGMLVVFAVSLATKAVVLFPALTENLEKAEASLILRDRARQLRLEERRNETIKRHALKKATSKVKTADQIVSGKNDIQTSSRVSELQNDSERIDQVRETKEK